jgi:hypothetical protein
MSRAEIAAKRKRERERIYQRSVAIKERRRARVRASLAREEGQIRAWREREESLPQRLLAGLDEAERLRQQLGWRRRDTQPASR